MLTDYNLFINTRFSSNNINAVFRRKKMSSGLFKNSSESCISDNQKSDGSESTMTVSESTMTVSESTVTITPKGRGKPQKKCHECTFLKRECTCCLSKGTLPDVKCQNKRQRGRTTCSKCRERTKYKIIRIPLSIVPAGNTKIDPQDETVFSAEEPGHRRADTYVNSVSEVRSEYTKIISNEGQNRTLSNLFIGEHMICGVETLDPRCEIPDHRYEYSEKMIYIISGKGVLLIEDQKQGAEIETGSMLFLPPKLTHRIKCISDAPLVFNYSFSPPLKVENMTPQGEQVKRKLAPENILNPYKSQKLDENL